MDNLRNILSTWSQRPGRAVIFDFNGTLSDDEPILEDIFIEVFGEHLGWQMTPDEYRRELLGHSDREIVEIATSRFAHADQDLVEKLMQLRMDRYRDRVAEHSPITVGAVELVERLAAENVPMAIVTGAQRTDVDLVLSGSPVGQHLKVIVAADDVRRGKPDPEGFLAGAALLGVDPSDVLVFEDSVPGVHAAAAAGMACIVVTGPNPNPAVVTIAPATVPALSARLLD